MTPQIWFSKALKHTLSPSTLRTCLLISQYFQPPSEFWACTSIPSTSLKHKIYLKALFNESIQNENIINAIWFTLLASFQVAQLVDLFVCISFKFRAVWGSSTALQSNSRFCFFGFLCRCGGSRPFWEVWSCKGFITTLKLNMATNQIHCMWQKQMSKLSSVSVFLGKILASSHLSLALILLAVHQQILFIHSNISFLSVEITAESLQARIII